MPVLAHVTTKIDTQQVALMKFMLEAVTPEGADALIRAAVEGAREVLADPAALAFDDVLGRTTPFDVVTRAVEKSCADAQECAGEENTLLNALREMHAGGSLVIEDHDDAYSLLLRHAEAGVLLGAALMYELLKGGVR